MISQERVLRAYPRGSFLAEGGFKRVYKAYDAVHERTQAMSVLDLRNLRKQGLEDTLGMELWVSYLLSQQSGEHLPLHSFRLIDSRVSDLRFVVSIPRRQSDAQPSCDCIPRSALVAHLPTAGALRKTLRKTLRTA